MSEGINVSMAPDSGHALPLDVMDSTADVAVNTTSTLNCLIFKGNRSKKHVTFRDSNLVLVREIPPRSSCSGSSSDEGSSDLEDDSCSSEDTESQTDSETEEEEIKRWPQASNEAFQDKAVTVMRTSPPSPSSLLSTLLDATGRSQLRPERVPIPWKNSSSFAGLKGSNDSSATILDRSRAISLVQSHTKSLSTTAPVQDLNIKKQESDRVSLSSRSSGQLLRPGKPLGFLHAEKKAKKLTPTLENGTTSKTARAGQRHHVLSDTMPKNNSGKTVKKKRVLYRRQDGKERLRGVAIRRAQDCRYKSNSATNGVTKKSKNVVGARDSLSLPPLGGGDATLLQTSEALRQMSLAQTNVYTLGGFLVPGKASKSHGTRVQVVKATTGIDDLKGREEGLSASGSSIKERIKIASSTSATSRRKRFYAWQMANGNLQENFQDSPCITPMWEAAVPVSATNSKSSL